MSTKVTFRRAEVSFLWRKFVFRDVRMQSCLAQVLSDTSSAITWNLCFSFKHQTEVGLHADVSEDRLPLEQRLPLDKNKFRRHDISQGLDREPPSLSPHFLLTIFIFYCPLNKTKPPKRTKPQKTKTKWSKQKPPRKQNETRRGKRPKRQNSLDVVLWAVRYLTKPDVKHVSDVSEWLN